MSFRTRLFGFRKPPVVYLGDVQMKLDWNITSQFCGRPAGRFNPPSSSDLKRYFSQTLELPDYEAEDPDRPSGGHLLHLAITDLHQGRFSLLDMNELCLPIAIRPSITVTGYLLDIASRNVLSEQTVTQKPPWFRYRHPVFIGMSALTGNSDPDAATPLGDMAAIEVLKKLKEDTLEKRK